MTEELDNLPPAAPAEPAATPPAAPVTPPTITADPVDPPKAPVQPTWPDDWRAKIAGDDKKELARLERFASPSELHRSYRALEQKLSSGEVKQALPKDATPEQLTEYRKSNGIPETFDKYDTSLPNGLVIGEQDKPIVDEFLKEMHAANATPDVTKAALASYYKIVESQTAQRQTEDAQYKEQSQDALRGEWGQDFRRNINLVNNLLETAPEGVKDRLLAARLADGKLLGDDPATLKFLVSMAREINPAAAVVPGANNAPAAISEELANLNRQMGDPRSDYWSKDKGSQLQARYRELVTAQQKLAKRA